MHLLQQYHHQGLFSWLVFFVSPCFVFGSFHLTLKSSSRTIIIIANRIPCHYYRYYHHQCNNKATVSIIMEYLHTDTQTFSNIFSLFIAFPCVVWQHHIVISITADASQPSLILVSLMIMTLYMFAWILSYKSMYIIAALVKNWPLPPLNIIQSFPSTCFMYYSCSLCFLTSLKLFFVCLLLYCQRFAFYYDDTTIHIHFISMGRIDRN